MKGRGWMISTVATLSCVLLACQSAPARRGEPSVLHTESAPSDERVTVENEPREPVAVAPPAPLGPETPVEISLPRPALWIEISLGRRVVAGTYYLTDECASVWFDEAQRQEWREGGQVHPSSDTLSSAWGRSGAYHDSPVGSRVICDVTSTAELRCRNFGCSSVWENEERSASAQRRCWDDPSPGRPSDIQRTRHFTPTRHWIGTHFRSTELSYTCLRAQGRVFCYPLLQGVRRPARVPAPELSAWSDVRDLAAGGSQACVVLGDGSVHCWGMPYMPEVSADRSNEEVVFEAMLEHSGHPWTPRRIEGLPPVVQISVGLRLACARTLDGRVFCWGAPACLVSPTFPSSP